MKRYYAVVGEGQFVYDTVDNTHTKLGEGRPLFPESPENDVVDDSPDPSDADHRE